MSLKLQMPWAYVAEGSYGTEVLGFRCRGLMWPWAYKSRSLYGRGPMWYGSLGLRVLWVCMAGAIWYRSLKPQISGALSVSVSGR